VRLVHRLDRDTSGVLLFARDPATARALARQRTAGHLSRDYLALAAGHPPASGTIDLPLGPDPGHRTRRRVYRPDGPAAPGDREDAAGRPALPAGFQEAHTSYRVVQYGAGATLLAARLGTGRTHQVRAHLAAAGYPLLADDLYGGPPWPGDGPAGQDGLARQALHAWRVRLRHPATGAALTLTAPLPDDLRAAARLVLRGPASLRAAHP
jgi:23S rRNA pseudouridine1911/1915/1917 synthase